MWCFPEKTCEKMIQVGFLLLLCIAIVTAGAPALPAPANPPCVNTFKPATNFYLANFSVTWYEVRQITPEGEGKCVSTFYTTNPEDKSLSVTRCWTEYACRTNAELTVTFGKTSTVYTIFHLNYDSTYGVYTCIAGKAYIFVYARLRRIDDSELTEINNAITAAGLNTKLLKLSPRSDC